MNKYDGWVNSETLNTQHDELKELKEEIDHAHKVLSKYIGKEYWSVAGRVEGLVSMFVREVEYLKDKPKDEWEKFFNQLKAELNKPV